MEIYRPRATEKTYREQAKRTYVFLVPEDASKQEVAKTISAEFKVTVTDVRILTRKGKATKYSKGKHAYPGTTFRRDKKLAYVTLKDGDSIKVFEEPEDTSSKKSDKKAEKSDKAEAGKKSDKKSEKQAVKEAKKSAKADKKSEKKGDK